MKKLYQVDFWDKSPYDDRPFWHKLGTYDLETALALIHDESTFRITASPLLCVVDMETGEVVEESYLPVLEETKEERIVYENENGFVKQTRFGDYEVFRYGARNLDGIPESGAWYSTTYGENYWRDWLGRSGSIYYDFDPLKAAIDHLNPTR